MYTGHFNILIYNCFSAMAARTTSREQVADFLKKVDRKEMTERRVAMRNQRDTFHVQFNSFVDLILHDRDDPTVESLDKSRALLDEVKERAMFFTFTYGGDEVNDILDELDIMAECAEEHYKEKRAALTSGNADAKGDSPTSGTVAAETSNSIATPMGNNELLSTDATRCLKPEETIRALNDDEIDMSSVPSSTTTGAMSPLDQPRSVAAQSPELSQINSSFDVAATSEQLAPLMDSDSDFSEAGDDVLMNDDAPRPRTPGASSDFGTLNGKLFSAAGVTHPSGATNDSKLGSLMRPPSPLEYVNGEFVNPHQCAHDNGRQHDPETSVSASSSNKLKEVRAPVVNNNGDLTTEVNDRAHDAPAIDGNGNASAEAAQHSPSAMNNRSRSPSRPAGEAVGSPQVALVASVSVISGATGGAVPKMKRKRRHRSRRRRANPLPIPMDSNVTDHRQSTGRQSTERPIAMVRHIQPKPLARIASNIPSECPACRMHRIRARHPLYRCQNFREYSLSERAHFIYRWNLCELCFNEGHGAEKTRGHSQTL